MAIYSFIVSFNNGTNEQNTDEITVNEHSFDSWSSNPQNYKQQKTSDLSFHLEFIFILIWFVCDLIFAGGEIKANRDLPMYIYKWAQPWPRTQA